AARGARRPHNPKTGPFLGAPGLGHHDLVNPGGDPPPEELVVLVDGVVEGPPPVHRRPVGRVAPPDDRDRHPRATDPAAAVQHENGAPVAGVLVQQDRRRAGQPGGHGGWRGRSWWQRSWWRKGEAAGRPGRGLAALVTQRGPELGPAGDQDGSPAGQPGHDERVPAPARLARRWPKGAAPAAGTPAAPALPRRPARNPVPALRGERGVRSEGGVVADLVGLDGSGGLRMPLVLGDQRDGRAWQRRLARAGSW